MIAALYIDPRGPYPAIASVDCWGEDRDARLYAGPHPVVAHPPCGAWGRMSRLHRADDRDLAPRAVEQVRAFSGVLEHPRYSRLWAACGLPRPGDLPDAHGGFTVEIDQCAWGHVARKPTWLYVVGVTRALVEAGIRTGGAPTHGIWYGRKERARLADGIRGLLVASKEQRRRTPPAFAAWLVSLAEQARGLTRDRHDTKIRA